MSNNSPWLLLRGLSRGAFHWHKFPKQLGVAYPDTEIFTLDLPGNGRRWRETSPSSIAAMVEAYRQQLVPIQQPLRIVALSMGGMVALQWLVQYPDEVADLVLINSSVGQQLPFYRRVRPKALLQLALGRLQGSLMGEQAVLAQTSNRYGRDMYLARAWANYARMCPVRVENILRQLWAAAWFQFPQYLPTGITGRITVVNSANDKLVDSHCSWRLAQTLGCRLLTHPTAGHDLPLDDGAWLVKQTLSQR